MLLKILVSLTLAVTTLSATIVAEDPLAAYRSAAKERWEADIKKLEALDAEQKDPEHAILFIGSSSIRLWETMSEDMAPFPTIRRGYGGAKFSDLAVFTERLVNPHKFDALAIFVANDISGSKTDKTPEQVLSLYQYVVETVRKSNPDQPIFFIAITPTSSRFQAWDRISRVNQLIEEYSEQTANLHFIDTAERYLKADGTPNDRLFRADRLHLNREGYRMWGNIIKAEMEKVLGPPAA